MTPSTSLRLIIGLATLLAWAFIGSRTYEGVFKLLLETPLGLLVVIAFLIGAGTHPPGRKPVVPPRRSQDDEDERPPRF